MKNDSISNVINKNENKSDFFANNFNITNNKYDADFEKTRIII